MKNKIIWAGLVVILIILVLIINNKPNNNSIKIGVITDLSGPAAYFGEKTVLGAEIVKSEFAKKGIDVQIIAEDYQLDAGKAATAAQKLLNVDHVNLIYADFNPGAISSASVLKNKQTPFIYAAAIESPLASVPNSFKTYLDYKQGCKNMADKFKERGIVKVGYLKVSLEYGDLCANGLKEAYGDNLFVEGYTLGDKDFRTQITKLKSEGVGAVVNVGFEGDTYNTLKNMREIGLKVPYGTVVDTLTKKVTDDFGGLLKGGLAFGYDKIDDSFKTKIEQFTGKKINDAGPEYTATALSYTHLTQAMEALKKCGDNGKCFSKEMSSKTSPNILGFEMFKDRIAVSKLKLFEY